MKYLRSTKIAGAGTNYLKKELRVGDSLKAVSVLNDTTAWRRSTVEIAKVGAADTDPLTIALFHRLIQVGLKSLGWLGSLKMENPFLVVRAVFQDCVAGDSLYLVVGYE